MKKLLSKLIISRRETIARCNLAIISAVLISAAFFLAENVSAGGSFYLSPASKTVPQNATFSVAVRVSSTDPINSVSAYLSYPADKLDFVSISTSGSAFDMQVENVGGGGQVKISRGLVGVVTGDKLIATVNFRAKLSSGSAPITFAAGTAASNANGDLVVSATSGGTYTFTTPPPPLPPPPPPDTTAPKISDVKVTGTAFKGATIEWKTDEAASSTVEYGLNTKYGLSAEGAGATKDHKVAFSSELLIPGVTYHFRVKSADATGNVGTGGDDTFKTSGYTVNVKVVDQKGEPVEGVEVTLASEIQKEKTGKGGIATFKDVAPGKHLVTVASKSGLVSSTIDVKEATEKEIASGKITPQSAEVKITPAGTDPLWYVAAALAGLIVILLAVAGVWGWHAWREKGAGKDGGPPTGSKGKKLGFIPVPLKLESEAAVKTEKAAPVVKPSSVSKPPPPEKTPVAKSQPPKGFEEPPVIQPKGESKMEIFRADSSK